MKQNVQDVILCNRLKKNYSVIMKTSHQPMYLEHSYCHDNFDKTYETKRMGGLSVTARLPWSKDLQNQANGGQSKIPLAWSSREWDEL